ncbi:hypothetical protein AMAG_05089 [Allomyces macrogynus ATCC 38327]|uniref:Uncharacterized protein n=1 Tax=Allomyces macrogynus (strain ATCC 38327) TaxID=578462 RepID=A0A0L0S7F9_ALLM3|nr:hypothetical protein AMAG_05089 [Allomyces macrogynus ATCC 38327]|eukprot:KNE58279.1 hypothetical protein AMAG_05089 [Allomyces macrogynus ATCC 38327]
MLAIPALDKDANAAAGRFDTADDDQDADHAASMQLIQDTLLADFLMAQEKELLRRDKALALCLCELDDRGVSDRANEGTNDLMSLVRTEDLSLYVLSPSHFIGERTVVLILVFPVWHRGP